MKKIFSILLSFILLAGHTGFTIGTHFCGGEAVESKIILNETHLGCDMADMEKSCDIPVKNDNHEDHFDNDPCCENEYQTAQTTDEFIKEAAPKSLHVDFAIAFIYTTLNLDLFPKTNHQSYTEYISPPIEKDLQVLFQTFIC